MKIITALGDSYINNKLREEKKYEIIGKDIQYQEGVLEILEENNNIDVVILTNNIPSEIDFKTLINKIIYLNNKIQIIVFLKEKSCEMEQFLNSKKIYKIYFFDKYNFNLFLNTFSKNIKKTNDEITTEIKELKGLIFNNKSINFEKNEMPYSNNIEEKNENKNIKIFSQNILNKKNITSNDCPTKDNINSIEKKIITVAGAAGSGKSIFSCVFSKLLEYKEQKILLIDFDEYKSCYTIFGVKNNKNNILENKIQRISKNIYCLDGNTFNIIEMNDLLDKVRKDFDFIIIDIHTIIKKEFLLTILNKSNYIFFLIIPNLLEIKKSKTILEVYDWDININKNKIKILFNKCCNNNISRDILNEIFYKYEILNYLEYDEKYMLYINKNLNLPIEYKKYEDIYLYIRKEKNESINH